MTHRVLWSVPVIAIVATAQADTLSPGQRMADAFLRGDVQTLWTAATPEMRGAFGSAQDLAAIGGESRKEGRP